MDYLKRTWAEIDLSALLHNFSAIKEHSGGKIASVVKADAYGHGASVIAPVLQTAGTDTLAVSNIDEAIELRRSGVTVPIIILGYTPAEYASELSQNGIIQTVYSLEYAKGLSESAVSAGVEIECHLKLDTGMSRLGFNCRDDSLSGLCEIEGVSALGGLCINGAFTHFATADRDGDENGLHTAAQFRRFLAACEKIEKTGIRLECKHCCNSAGLMLQKDMHGSLTRPGIILYGLTPSADLSPTLPLIPVMTFKSTVSFVKEIKAGDAVSYGRHFVAERDMRVATVAVGYADGYPRALSSKGHVLINNVKAPILGNVCMDQMVVDVSEIENVVTGTEVTLFGKGLPVEEIAAVCGTINYELVCGVSRRVPRVYLQNGREVRVVDYILDR